MRSMRRRNRSIVLVILVLLIGIGYASLNAELKIDGKINYADYNLLYCDVNVLSCYHLY